MKAILVEFTGEQELEDTLQALRDVAVRDPNLKGKLKNDLLNNLILSLEKNRKTDYGKLKELLNDGYSIVLHSEYDDLGSGIKYDPKNTNVS